MAKKQLDLKTGQLTEWPEKYSDIEHNPSAIRLNSETSQEQITELFQQQSFPELILIEFPMFTDGRVFSLATTLRHHFNYTGIIAATGHVLPDQLSYLTRCGFDWLELVEESAPSSTLQECLSFFSVRYQPS